jgi:hypothetical protein
VVSAERGTGSVGIDTVDGTGSVGVAERGAGSVGLVAVTSANANATASDASPEARRTKESGAKGWFSAFVILVIDPALIQDPGHPKASRR